MNPLGLFSILNHNEKKLRRIIFDSTKQNDSKKSDSRTVLFFDRMYCSSMPDVVIFFNDKNDNRFAIHDVKDITIDSLDSYDKITIHSNNKKHTFIFDYFDTDVMYNDWTSEKKNSLLREFHIIKADCT